MDDLLEAEKSGVEGGVLSPLKLIGSLHCRLYWTAEVFLGCMNADEGVSGNPHDAVRLWRGPWSSFTPGNGRSIPLLVSQR